jgi:GAF domain-containing protein
MNQTAPKSNQESSAATFKFGRWREGFLQAMLIGSAIFGFIALAGNFVTQSSVTDLVIYSTVFGILLLTILIRFPYWLKASVLLILVYAIILSDFWDEGIWGGGRLYMVVLVVMASILFSPRAGIIALIISTVTTVIGGWLILTGQVQLTSAGIPTGFLSDWISAGLTDILVGAVLIIGLRLVQSEFEQARDLAGSAIRDVEEQRRNLELRVQERTVQLSRKSDLLRSSALIARSVAELQDVPTIMERTVRGASDLFGFYHVAIYLFDEQKRMAFLQAASTNVGKKMVEDGFYIESDPKNVIGYISEQNKSYILTDANDENKTRLLSEGKLELTSSEIVIPLTVRGKITGVIDFQSKESFTFDQDEIEILQSLADQIAISIDSARLLDETQAFVNELEAVTTQQMGDVWKRYLANRVLAYQYTASGVKSVTPGQVKTKSKKDMRIPLRLRGQDIGAIAFQSKENVRWTASVRDLAEKVADQVALALDNSRLLEETRRRATQQQTVNEISARLNRSLDFDTLLQTAARELGKLPEVAEVAVFVGEMNELGPNTSSDGHH